MNEVYVKMSKYYTATIRRVEDFPHPDGPTIDKNSLFFTAKDRPFFCPWEKEYFSRIS